jgi:hypothetical protein
MNEYECYKKLYGNLVLEIRHHSTYLFGIYHDGCFVWFNHICDIGLTNRKIRYA